MVPNKIIGIIQARMGSTRLPGKMTMDLCGYPLLHWVIERIKRSTTLDGIVLATSKNSRDKVLVDIAKKHGVYAFQGSEQNVLNRFVEAAKCYDATIIVRICADNPLVAHEEIDRLVKFYLAKMPDYSFNHIPKFDNEYPDGLGSEIFSTQLLEMIEVKAENDRHREHVTSYIWNHISRFDIKTFKCPQPYNIPEMKLDVDTDADLAQLRKLCSRLTFQSTPTDIFNAWTKLKALNCF